jgi:hypothetical protein
MKRESSLPLSQEHGLKTANAKRKKKTAKGSTK